MGFSVSASTAIIFAGLFLAVGVLYPAVSNGYEQIHDAEVDRDDAQLDTRNTDIEIDALSSDTITVNNTGSTTLDVNNTDLVIDGEYQPRDYTTSVDGDFETDLWQPGETLELTEFDGTPGRVRITTENGITDSGEI